MTNDNIPLQHIVDLGHSSLISLGVLGVAIEVTLIGYLFVTSLVGLYTIPFIRMIRPKLGDTSLTHLILNCGLFLILSSALPLLSKILGQFSCKHSPIQLLARMRKC